MEIPIEMQLLLLCARAPLAEDDIARIRALLRQELDWGVVFQLAEHHRSIPLLATRLRELGSDLLSGEIHATLQAHHRDRSIHNLILAQEMIRLVDLLPSEGVDAIPFKGPVSGILVYRDISMRTGNDIDLLVKPDEHRTAERALQCEGYVIQTRYPHAMQSSLRHEQLGVSVDLHWGIPPDNLQLRARRFWEKLEPVNLLGRELLTLSPRDTLLVTAVNAVKEYWGPSLHHLSDIATLTQDYSEDNWSAAFGRAREVGCRRVLAAALLFAHRVLNMPLPSSGPSRLLQHPDITGVVDELQEHLLMPIPADGNEPPMQLFHHRAAQAYYVALMDSPWRRWGHLIAWIVTPNEADRTFIKLPQSLAFLYYLIRPARLLIRRL